MQKLGDIKKAKEIYPRSRVGEEKYIWHACIDCGRESWVRYSVGLDIPLAKRCGHCALIARQLTGENHPRWKGGRVTYRGYIYIWLLRDDFFRSMANKSGHVSEHRLIMAKSLRPSMNTDLGSTG